MSPFPSRDPGTDLLAGPPVDAAGDIWTYDQTIQALLEYTSAGSLLATHPFPLGRVFDFSFTPAGNAIFVYQSVPEPHAAVVFVMATIAILRQRRQR